ncbi:helix-turn-helix domain-containing protein [Labrys sp. (in: a-proteobacteria)]|uniref:helix-turn-helix domain-containing protein n=1 Tax=Labrys sp. (in: a-proteobacteria) TaxID=1917972 RepID=UPI0039E2B648
MASIVIRKPRTIEAAAESACTNGRSSAVPEMLLTLRQVMAFASVSDATVRRWIRHGHLRVYRAGRQVRVDKADLVSFMRGSIQL